MSKARRLFFALVPGPLVASQIEELQKSLPLTGRPAKPHQLHATLAFLGMQLPEVIPDILSVASGLKFRSCLCVMDRLGQFRRAGVLWLGASKVPAELMDFQQALVGSLLEAGIGYDLKPWEFHITLYRKLRKRPEIIPPIAIEWPLDGFHLIESVSVGRGVEYHSIGHWKAG